MRLLKATEMLKSEPEMTEKRPEMDYTPKGRKAEGHRTKGYNKQGKKARFKRAAPANKPEKQESNKANTVEDTFGKSQLVKAAGGAGLVQQDVQVQGPHGTYTAKRWVKPGEKPEPGAKVHKLEQPQAGKPAAKGPKKPIKGLDLKQDGYYYYGGMRLTDDPERAQAYADKVVEFEAKAGGDGKGQPEDIRVGHRIRIKPTARSGGVREHKERGIVATVTERLKDGYKIKDDQGRTFMVSHASLEFAKSKRGPFQLVVLRKARKLVDPSPMPPKKWMQRAIKGIMTSDPTLTEERAGAIAGANWYKKMSHRKRAAVRHAEGKGYRKEATAKSRLVVYPAALHHITTPRRPQ